MQVMLDVIVRTLADKARSAMLLRALDSIQDQQGGAARPIVVVNGPQVDPATLDALKQRPGILVVEIPEASMRLARMAGRQQVTAPYFAYLDDDDELVAGALKQPLDWMDAHADCDVMVSNGSFVDAAGGLSEKTHLGEHAADPALGLLHECWLTPGASIFRTATIPLEILSADWSQLEWTQLAFELCAQRKRLHFLDVKTVLIHDTPGSMSKKLAHFEAAYRLFGWVRRDGRLTLAVRRGAYRKCLRILHNLVLPYLQHGQYWRAWACHLQSLRPPATFSYLLFTRKLLWRFDRERLGA